MAKSKPEIIADIKTYINNLTSKYSDWYVGIASDPQKRLFTDHTVNKDSDLWIYRECATSDIAREVEEYFVNTLKTDGGPGGGDYSTKYVYAYKKSTQTTE